MTIKIKLIKVFKLNIKITGVRRYGVREWHAGWEALQRCQDHRDIRGNLGNSEVGNSRTAVKGVQTVDFSETNLKS